MSTPSTDPHISRSTQRLLHGGALNFFTGNPTVDGVSRFLLSASDVDVGNATDYPLTAATRFAWQQYLNSVEKLSWSITYDYDDGAGRIESASVSGTNYLAPSLYNETSTPSLPGLEHRRQMLAFQPAGSVGLRLFPDGFEDTSIIIPDAVTRENSSGPLSPADLELQFILFNNFTQSKNIAHDPATGEYYPQLFFRITAGSREFVTDLNLGHVAGTVTVEDLGTCNLYYSDAFASVTFSATIATRFTDP